MSDRKFEAMSSGAVLVSILQLFSLSKVLFHTSAAVPFVSLFKSKKSALLCCTFLSGVKCSLNKVYSLSNGNALGCRSLTVFAISVNARLSDRPKECIFDLEFQLVPELWQYYFRVGHSS